LFNTAQGGQYNQARKQTSFPRYVSGVPIVRKSAGVHVGAEHLDGVHRG
jgi:hypothetical protein